MKNIFSGKEKAPKVNSAMARATEEGPFAPAVEKTKKVTNTPLSVQQAKQMVKARVFRKRIL